MNGGYNTLHSFSQFHNVANSWQSSAKEIRVEGYLSNFPSDRMKTFENSKKENEVGIGWVAITFKAFFVWVARSPCSVLISHTRGIYLVRKRTIIKSFIYYTNQSIGLSNVLKTFKTLRLSNQYEYNKIHLRVGRRICTNGIDFNNSIQRTKVKSHTADRYLSLSISTPAS